MEYSTSSITLSVTGIHHSTKICRTNSYIGQKIDQFSDQQVQGQGPLILTKNSIKSLHVISFFHFLSIFFIPVKENLEFVLVSQIFTVVFQFFSHCLTLCEPMDCSTSSFPVNHQLLELAQLHVHRVSDAIQPSVILYHPLFLLPSIFPSIRVFSSESVLRIRQPKYWSFSFSISPSNEYSGSISFRMDWFDRLAVQGTLKSLLQHHSSKHQFFGAQLSLWSNSHIHT